MKKYLIPLACLAAIGIAAPTTAAPVEPTWPLGPMYNYTADCTGVTTETARWPDGSTGTLTINGEVFEMPLNTTSHFPSDGASYLFTVYFTVPGQVPWSEYQHVYCAEPVAAETVVAEPAPVIVPPVERERREVVPEPNYAIPSESM